MTENRQITGYDAMCLYSDTRVSESWVSQALFSTMRTENLIQCSLPYSGYGPMFEVKTVTNVVMKLGSPRRGHKVAGRLNKDRPT